MSGSRGVSLSRWRHGSLRADSPALADFYEFSITMTYFQACLGLNSSFNTYSDDS